MYFYIHNNNTLYTLTDAVIYINDDNSTRHIVIKIGDIYLNKQIRILKIK